MKGIVVFDLDGTLADTAPDIMATLNVLLEREGLPKLPVEAAHSLVGAGARALLQRGFKAAGEVLTEDRLDRLFQDFLDHYAENLSAGTSLYPGVVGALDALAAKGLKLAICTNKPQHHARKLMDLMAIGSRFAFIAGRDTFSFCKPDPRHLTATIAQAQGAGQAIMVGDSATDVNTARAAGIPVIGVPFGYTDVPMRDLKPDILIDHFDELPAAVARLARD